MLELPELLNSIVLLVGAGETVQRAIIRCVESHRGIRIILCIRS